MKKKSETKKLEKAEPKAARNKAAGILDGEVNKAVLYQAVRMYQANQRQGTADTKTREQVRGGGRKPWKQKGTGRARVGSSRSPLWKGGGTIFGPHPRDYYYTLPQKIRSEALRSSLNAKNNDKELLVIDAVVVDKPKTKEFNKVMSSLKIALDTKTLFVLDKIDENLRLSSRNIGTVVLKRAEDLNAMDVLNVKKLVLTKTALSIITKRLEG